MSRTDIGTDARAEATEPLLPIEKKLIGWSLTIGVVLLVILVVLARVSPI